MKKQPVPFRTNLIIRFIVFVAFNLFFWVYNIRSNMPRNVKKLKPPFLVLGNHIGLWDPFVTGTFLKPYTHFVASDAAFRTPFMGFFLRNLGAIPVKKNMRDSKVVRDIITVIRRKRSVGIFPEAVRNWAGSNFPMDPSIAKLIRLLKVPVVVPMMRGMNLFNPRWSEKLRRCKVVVDYTLLFTEEQVKNLSEEEIMAGLVKEMTHDEVEYQRKTMVKLRSNKRAEHISHALYVCPECKAIDSFDCKGNDFKCRECAYDIHIDDYGFFERPGGGTLHFDNIRDWYYWEEKYMTDFIADKFDQQEQGVIFEDRKSKMYHGSGEDEVKYMGEADLAFYIDKLVISQEGKPDVVLNYEELQTLNPQVNERLEMYYNNESYRFFGGRPGVSALKWEVAVNAVWKKLGMDNKLAPYIKPK